MAAWDTQIKDLVDWTLQGAKVWEATSKDLIDQAMKEAQRLASERAQQLDEDSSPEPTAPTEAPAQSGEVSLSSTDLSTIVEDPYFEQVTALESHADTYDTDSSVQQNIKNSKKKTDTETAGSTPAISVSTISELGQVGPASAPEPDIKMLSLTRISHGFEHIEAPESEKVVVPQRL
jgi:hypothetical protein